VLRRILPSVSSISEKQTLVQNLITNFFFYIWFVIVQIEIDIEPTDKVERIKERVEEKEGIPPQQQRLIFSGKQM
jgi:hypothetical protein